MRLLVFEDQGQVSSARPSGRCHHEAHLRQRYKIVYRKIGCTAAGIVKVFQAQHRQRYLGFQGSILLACVIRKVNYFLMDLIISYPYCERNKIFILLRSDKPEKMGRSAAFPNPCADCSPLPRWGAASLPCSLATK